MNGQDSWCFVLKSIPTFKPKVAPTPPRALSVVRWASRNQPSPDTCSSSHCTFVLMENSYMPFLPTTSTATNTILRQPNMGCSQNSEFSIYEPMNSKNFSSKPITTAPNSQFHHPTQFMAPYQSLQLPYRHPIEQTDHSLAYPFFLGQNGIEFGSIIASNGVQHGSCFMQTDGVSKAEERRMLDPYGSKAARIKRKLARQRSLSLQRNASSGATAQVDKRRLNSSGADNDVNINNDTKRDLYMFCTSDNKAYLGLQRLRVLLRKELKNSDVGSLGRIVLPKVRFYLIHDGFWSNNKSRMYVLENTADFVKQNGLGIGDFLTLYEDEGKNLYFSVIKVERVAAAEPSNNQPCDSQNNYMDMPFTGPLRDEEETCLELLIEQLKHTEHEESNDLMTLAMDATYSHGPPAADESQHFVSDANVKITATELQTSSTSLRGKARSVDEIQINFDDCYSGLDMLPDGIRLPRFPIHTFSSLLSMAITSAAAAVPALSSLAHRVPIPSISFLFPDSTRPFSLSRSFRSFSLTPQAKASDIEISFFDDLNPEDEAVAFDPPTPPEGFIPPPAFDDGPEETEDEVAAAYEELYGPAYSGVSVLGNDVYVMDSKLKKTSAFGKVTKEKVRDGFEERVVQVRRVTKVVKGGKQLHFRAIVVVGDKQGQVGVGVGKAKEVIAAVQKSAVNARRNLITIPMTKYLTFPHRSEGDYGAAKVMLRPAAPGTGVIAGGAVRIVLEMAGVENALGKQLGSKNALNNARATVVAVQKMKQFREVAQERGIPMEELWK
ncbi:B3 domain-containing transcription factor LEC2-like [Gossypium australe]|uniref:Small ribosomal subunit protein uS5c n=2 Tax=Gossypium TaxID=3633 RepID=A0A5B6X723_9ROSI|nr:B3 domain-containing transcription factor LEC2-like [Gossypium australe]